MSKDLFSRQSDMYARYRPRYPKELIDYILQFVPRSEAAWDCATGNGQAAELLASDFQTVRATDISERQISNAIQNPRIHYSVSPAEKTFFNDGSFDLVTVAQAYHWFNFFAFEKEVKRVVRPGGVIAIWGYAQSVSEFPDINQKIKIFYDETVGPFWDPERKYVDEHYRSVPFPYDELPTKEFSIRVDWSLQELAGYLNSWSSVQHFIKANGFNPVEILQADLDKVWPTSATIAFRFPLFLRLGRI